MTFAERLARIQAAFGRTTTRRELTPEEQRAIADKWLAIMLRSYILRASGERYNGTRWDERQKTSDDDGHLLNSHGNRYDGDKYHSGRQPGCWISEQVFAKIANGAYRYGNWYVNVGEMG